MQPRTDLPCHAIERKRYPDRHHRNSRSGQKHLPYNAFGAVAIAAGHRVAVLAADPSSTRSGGSILGDKTRMEDLSRSEQAFIRPTPSSGHLGGMARMARETIVLCEAAGYDMILLETVGVGQSELEVDQMTDLNLLLMVPGGRR